MLSLGNFHLNLKKLLRNQCFEVDSSRKIEATTEDILHFTTFSDLCSWRTDTHEDIIL